MTDILSGGIKENGYYINLKQQINSGKFAFTNIEYMLFSLLRTEVYFTLQKKPSETIFSIAIEKLKELKTYDFLRKPKTLKITTQEIAEGLNSLKYKKLLISCKSDGTFITYKLNYSVFHSLKEERNFIRTAVRPIESRFRGRPFIRVLQEIMIRSSSVSCEFQGSKIKTGEFLLGRKTTHRQLGMNFNDFTDSVRTAKAHNLIAVTGKFRKEGLTSYSKYKLVCRFTEEQDLFFN